MNRRDFLKTASVSLMALSLPACKTLAPSKASVTIAKPNIILILSDDVGITDIHCCGGDHFKTPHIDALAQTGTRFEYCYSTPLCGPSRCELLTGRYPFRTGLVSDHSNNAIDPTREIMMPTVLKTAGYVTGSVGKWGELCLGPAEWGFDENIVFPRGTYYWAGRKTNYSLNGQVKKPGPTEYLPETLHTFAVDFITRHKDQPFFLYYPMSHLHSPIMHTPDSKAGANADELYAENIAYMDKLVGKLVAELDRLQLREKTLIIFTSDNGTGHFIKGTSTIEDQTINGHKGTLLEGGSRVPLVVNWPGTTPAGEVNHDLTDFSDFFPTLAAIAGARLPHGVIIDGHSFAAQIKGQKGKPRNWVYVELDGKSYVRDARYKLNNQGDLFDMHEAPFREIPIPPDTSNVADIAARKRLQKILAQHPAAPVSPKPAKKKQQENPV